MLSRDPFNQFDSMMNRLSNGGGNRPDPMREMNRSILPNGFKSPPQPMGQAYPPLDDMDPYMAINGSPQAGGMINGVPNMLPRSSSEAVYDSTPKYRQLPCRTFISVGTCPYRERCVYLHDPRCICREAKTKTRRKNKEDTCVDSLFWPIMPYNLVIAKLDNNRQPHVIQPYNVPPPQNDPFYRHDQSVYSIWMHFVDFCVANNELPPMGPNMYANYDLSPCFQAPDTPMNAYTKLPRLPVFRVLSACHGQEVAGEEVAALFDKLTKLSGDLSKPVTSQEVMLLACHTKEVLGPLMARRSAVNNNKVFATHPMNANNAAQFAFEDHFLPTNRNSLMKGLRAHSPNTVSNIFSPMGSNENNIVSGITTKGGNSLCEGIAMSNNTAVNALNGFENRLFFTSPQDGQSDNESNDDLLDTSNISDANLDSDPYDQMMMPPKTVGDKVNRMSITSSSATTTASSIDYNDIAAYDNTTSNTVSSVSGNKGNSSGMLSFSGLLHSGF